LKMIRKHHGDEHPAVSTALNNMALMCQSQGDYTKACAYFEQALELETRLMGDGHPNLALYRHNLARLFEEAGDSEAAQREYNLGLAIMGRDIGPASPVTVKLLEGLANFSERYRLHGKARALRARARRVRSQIEQSLLA